MSLLPAAVIAPSGPFDPEPFQKGLDVIGARYAPRFDERVFSRFRYLAGDDASRATELQRALDDASLHAIFAARGGYGAMRLLPHIVFPERVPPLVGFSDITALHAALARHGHKSIHGPVLTQLGKQPPEVVKRLLALLNAEPVDPLVGRECVVDGVAEGPLVGGNLAVFASLIGTPYFPETRGAVLLLEDIGERPYRVDRLWTQLALAGVLDGVAGIALGEFTDCEEKGANYRIGDVLRDLARDAGKPCVMGFDIGHGAVNQPVLLGARARLDANAMSLETLEALK